MPEKKSKAPAKNPLIPEGMTSEQIRDEMRRIDSMLSAGQDPFGLKPVGKVVRDVKSELDNMMIRVQEKREAHSNKFLPLLQKEPYTRYCVLHPAEIEQLDYEASLDAGFRNDELKPVYNACPECRHDRLVNEKYRMWILRGVPKKVAHATFENYITNGNEQKVKARSKVMSICERGSGFMILTGDPGTGKSHLTAAMFKTNYVENSVFITQADLLGLLRESYDSGGTEKLVKRLQKAPRFVLDELDESLGGGDTGRGQDIGPFLYRVFAYRYDRDLITGLTSNHDLTKVLSILGPRLEDRMAQNYIAASLTGASYRRANRRT